MIKQIAEDVIDRIKEEAARWGTLKQEIKKTIVGQDRTIDRLLVGLLCNGHILLEGVPGLAKTTLVKTLANALGVTFNRIQLRLICCLLMLLEHFYTILKHSCFKQKKGQILQILL